MSVSFHPGDITMHLGLDGFGQTQVGVVVNLASIVICENKSRSMAGIQVECFALSTIVFIQSDCLETLE